MRYLYQLALLACCVSAQSPQPFSVSLGAKIGAPLNEPSPRFSFPQSGTTVQGRWTGGPTVEFHLPLHLSVEFDALYRNSRDTATFPFQAGPDSSPYIVTTFQKTNAWELPLMLKYRFQVGPVRPFISGGFQWTPMQSKVSWQYQCSGPQTSCAPIGSVTGGSFRGEFENSVVHSGPVAGAGLEFKTRLITIAPEVRVTRPTNGYPRDTRVTALVGFSFGTKR